MNCIEVNNITKNFGNTCALNDVNLKFEQNKIYGLLGRNGAGKSTLLNIITGRIFSEQGEVLVDGEKALENDSALEKIYLMSEKTYYPKRMKIKDAFKWTKSFYPNFDEDYAKKVAQSFELNINKTVKSLSTGYSSIFKLIIALSVNTPYVFLDEPILGLDANHRELFYKTLIEKYTESPCTMVISTHLIEEISGIIEEIIIVKNGQIIKNESCETLMQSGYSISGCASQIELYIQDKDVIGLDKLGGLRTAYILGKIDNEIPVGLEVSKLDLQKLFIKLTN